MSYILIKCRLVTERYCNPARRITGGHENNRPHLSCIDPVKGTQEVRAIGYPAGRRKSRIYAGTLCFTISSCLNRPIVGPTPPKLPGHASNLRHHRLQHLPLLVKGFRKKFLSFSPARPAARVRSPHTLDTDAPSDGGCPACAGARPPRPAGILRRIRTVWAPPNRKNRFFRAQSTAARIVSPNIHNISALKAPL